MATPNPILNQLVELFVTNETEGGTYGSLAELAPDLTEAEAYKVQMEAVGALRQRGAQSTGYKIAATNEASQQMLGLKEPAYGELLSTMAIADGGTVSAARFAKGRLECEIVFKMGAALAGEDVDADAVLAATEAVYGAFELVDLRNQGWSLGMAEVICYDGLAKHYVLAEAGVAPDAIDFVNQQATLYKQGEEIASGTGAAALGNPVDAVIWLVRKLASQGRVLQSGDLVMTGSMTPPQPMTAGDRFNADFPALGAVSVQITE